MSVYNCVQVWHTIQHSTVLIIFSLILQKIITESYTHTVDTVHTCSQFITAN